MMRDQFPKLDKTLKRDGALWVFKLNTGQGDHAIVFLDDYIQQIDCVLKKMVSNKEGDFAVFGWFKKHVMSKLEPSISHQELWQWQWQLLSFGGRVKDDHISLLVNAGDLSLPSDVCLPKGVIRGCSESVIFKRLQPNGIQLALALLISKKRLYFILAMRCFVRLEVLDTDLQSQITLIWDSNL